MAVYTEVSNNELSAFLTAYDIGTLLSYKGIAEGVENSNFLLHTTGGYFILTLFEKRVNASDLPYFMGLMDHLFRHGVACPEPVHMRTGEILGTLAARPAAIVTFLDGIALSSPTTVQCEALGGGLANLHLAGLEFKGHRTNALTVSDWRPLFDRAGEGIGLIAPGLWQLIEDELGFLENSWPDNLPTGVIHADLFPDNVFFLDDSLAGFIDFYFSCNDILAYDIAICINAWCFDGDEKFCPERSRHLLKGYQNIRSLSNEEAEFLPILIRGAAIRFLLTRAYDWINTPKDAVVTLKKPHEYVNKLKFHQSIANINIYGVRNIEFGVGNGN